MGDCKHEAFLLDKRVNESLELSMAISEFLDGRGELTVPVAVNALLVTAVVQSHIAGVPLEILQSLLRMNYNLTVEALCDDQGRCKQCGEDHNAG